MTDREKAELYDHMKEVAKANGFDSLTEAITDAVKYRELVNSVCKAVKEDAQWHS